MDVESRINTLLGAREYLVHWLEITTLRTENNPSASDEVVWNNTLNHILQTTRELLEFMDQAITNLRPLLPEDVRQLPWMRGPL
jgi:hypothetical protein